MTGGLEAERLRSSRFTKGEDDLFGRDMASCDAPLSERGDLGVDLWIAPYGGAERWAVTHSKDTGFADLLFTLSGGKPVPLLVGISEKK